MSEAQKNVVKNMTTWFPYSIFMLRKLPSIFFWGIKTQSISAEKAIVKIPFRWTTQNPFGSIYFAALAGAAELSTGALALFHLAGRPLHSMLVIEAKAEFYKKASSDTEFVCLDGELMRQALDRITMLGEESTCTVISEGFDTNGVLVMRFWITWSFKRKQ